MDKMDPAEFERKREIYDKLALKIGRANMVWNDVHMEIFLLFKELSGMNFHNAEAVFFSIRTDSAQRDMTLALAKSALWNQPSQFDQIKSTINLVGKLASERNAAIHMAWIVNDGSDRPSPYLRVNPHPGLKDDAIAQFDALESALIDIFLKLSKIRKSLTLSPSLDKAPSPIDQQEPNQSGIGLLNFALDSELPLQSSPE